LGKLRKENGMKMTNTHLFGNILSMINLLNDSDREPRYNVLEAVPILLKTKPMTMMGRARADGNDP
jgi:hypothetical protein